MPPPCSLTVPVGEAVNVSALPTSGFGSFNYWQPALPGCASSSSVCTFPMPNNHMGTVANFD
jgi:hypothetical protein